MSLLDLAPVEDLEANLKQRKGQEPVPEMGFLATRIGPGMPWPTRVSIHQRFPLPFRAQLTPAGIVAVRWVQDLSMHTTLSRLDVAVLDTSASARTEMSPGGLYVVERNGGTGFIYIRPGAHGCFLITDFSKGILEP